MWSQKTVNVELELCVPERHLFTVQSCVNKSRQEVSYARLCYVAVLYKVRVARRSPYHRPHCIPLTTFEAREADSCKEASGKRRGKQSWTGGEENVAASSNFSDFSLKYEMSNNFGTKLDLSNHLHLH